MAVDPLGTQLRIVVDSLRVEAKRHEKRGNKAGGVIALVESFIAEAFNDLADQMEK